MKLSLSLALVLALVCLGCRGDSGPSSVLYTQFDKFPPNVTWGYYGYSGMLVVQNNTYEIQNGSLTYFVTPNITVFNDFFTLPTNNSNVSSDRYWYISEKGVVVYSLTSDDCIHLELNPQCANWTRNGTLWSRNCTLQLTNQSQSQPLKIVATFHVSVTLNNKVQRFYLGLTSNGALLASLDLTTNDYLPVISRELIYLPLVCQIKAKANLTVPILERAVFGTDLGIAQSLRP
eukprot:TRINITY_DN2568_c0_g1_i1.p1 TRINITY_DN2568_c0_g1~~TRINITY_DN2568_c0_g1_i1.p1  ORF type:complete len:233 (-),score=24.96 TRINITY_DN2568_c0_g1_i1:38-736(-)